MCSRVTCHHVYSSTLDLEIVLWIIDLWFVHDQRGVLLLPSVPGYCTACGMRVKSGQLYQLEALGISAELKAKVCWIPFSVSVSVLLSPSLLVLEFISTHGNIEREATKTHIVGILFEFLINLWWEAGVCSALCRLLPFDIEIETQDEDEEIRVLWSKPRTFTYCAH
jgi:hypothetical protein